MAALVQLRHMRNSNQLAVFTEFQQHMESDRFREGVRFVRNEFPSRMHEPEFRAKMLSNDAPEWELVRDMLNYLDHTGAIVKHRMVDLDLACDLFYGRVVGFWTTLAPLIATRRQQAGIRLWEDFEYLYLECMRFRERFPNGTFPQSYGSAPLPEPWPQLRGESANT